MKENITDNDVLGFIKSNRRFKCEMDEKQYYLLDDKKEEIAFLWFKNLLGGWRLMLKTDEGDEWKERGVIDSVSKLKTFMI